MPYRGIPYAVLDARYLRLDCTNDPLTAGLEINAATAGEPVLTLLTTDDNITNPYLDLNNSGTPMPYIMEKDGTRFLCDVAIDNMFLGLGAGNFTLTGINNVGLGSRTLAALTTANGNMALGTISLGVATSGGANMAIGTGTMRKLTTGQSNVGVGNFCLYELVSGSFNVGIGLGTLRNATASQNVAVGAYAHWSGLGLRRCVGIGMYANYANTAANDVVGIGHSALYSNTGTENVGVGTSAGRLQQTGVGSVYIGHEAGYGSALHNKSYCVMIGYQAGYNEILSNRLYIANSNTATPLIYGEFDTWRLAFGNQYAVDKYGELAHASGFFAAAGDAQASPDSFIVRRAVASHAVNTWYALYPDGGTTPERLTIAADSVWMVDVLVIGLTQNAAQQWAYQIIGVLERDNANNTTLAVQTVTTHFESDAFYDAQLVADDANEALEVQVRRIAGGADYDIRWCCTIRHCQVGYP